MTFMTETDGASEILKSDKLGRVQFPRNDVRRSLKRNSQKFTGTGY